MSRRPGVLLLTAAIVFAGCVDGIINGGDSPEVDVGGEIDGARVGGRQLRRLTAREYDNSVRVVFGLPADWPGAGLPADVSSELGFDNDAEALAVDGPRARALVAAAEKVAALVVDTRLGDVAGCAARDRACAAVLIDQFGPRLFRRDLTDAERARYLTAYDALAAETQDADEALAYTVVALLNSPNFLYRFELGTLVDSASGIYELTGEEVATALAYTFSAHPPDAELLERGRRGELATPEARLAEAQRLLDTPGGHQVIEDFTRRWLRYDEVRNLVKDETVAPGFTNLREDMAEETRRFLRYVIFEQRGGIEQLFTSDVTFLTAALAQHYGLPAPTEAFGMVQRPAAQSLGILAQGSMLSRYALTGLSSPPQRGAFVQRHLLCQPLPPPPPNAGEPPIPAPGSTTRELYEAHSTVPECQGCHRIIDGIGFGLEGFDTAGRWRTTEQNKPIDATGQLAGVSFTDGKELAALLGRSPEVGHCVAGLMAAYAFGSSAAEGFVDPPRATALGSGTTSLHDYFTQLAVTPHFNLRIERVR